MREFIDALNEAPIEDFGLVGDFNKSSAFRHKDDRGILTSPKGVAKIHSKWLNTPYPFRLFFVNTPEATNTANHEVGAVDAAWLQERMPKAYAEIKDRLSRDAINVIYNGNYGAEREPMTAWTIAHRFGHAISRYGTFAWGQKTPRQVDGFTDARNFLIKCSSTLLNDHYLRGSTIPGSEEGLDDHSRRYAQAKDRQRYANPSYGYGGYDSGPRIDAEKALLGLYHGIGTMKSARDKNIRNEFEFLLELLAQFILTGRVKFNDAPKFIKIGRDTYSFKGDVDDANSYIHDYFESSINDYLDALVGACVGRTFVM